MQFYYIRHGQSQNNLLWEQTGSDEGRVVDAELTPAGRLQAEALAEFLGGSEPRAETDARDSQNRRGFGITHLYCSLMTRSVATAAVVAAALDLPLLGWVDAHETGGMFLRDPESGELVGQPGKTRAEFAARYPELVLPEAVGEEGWWNRPFEADEERAPRAQRFLEDLLERHGGTDDRVVVVSHAGFYNHVLTAILGVPVPSGRWFVLNNAATSRVDFHADRVDFVYLNRADYLPRDLVT